MGSDGGGGGGAVLGIILIFHIQQLCFLEVRVLPCLCLGWSSSCNLLCCAAAFPSGVPGQDIQDQEHGEGLQNTGGQGVGDQETVE